MELSLLIDRYPTLYHMAEDGAWPSIREHGLLSTQALVDLFDPPADVRVDILGAVRRDSIEIEHPIYGRARVRDQRPLKFIDSVLTPGTSRAEFLDALNGRVFFWLSYERLTRLLGARLYRNRRQMVLHVDTAALLETYGALAELAPYNTGSMHVPTAPPRGADVFVPIVDYPYDEWRRRRTNTDAVVELVIPYAVPDIARYVTRVETWSNGVGKIMPRD
jgi:hypothetical protein